jgi:enoyl-[acyl-carrier protein] reductase I
MARDRTASALAWKVNQDLPVGKGTTIEEFVALAGKRKYVIDVAPWGEGRITIDGREIARLADAKDRQQAFRSLSVIAEQHLKGEPIKVSIPNRTPLFLLPKPSFSKTREV